MDEIKLIKEAQRGNVDAFADLLYIYQNRLKNTAFALCPEEVEDLLQETYLAAFKSIRRFRGRSSFYTWIYRIMLNIAYKKFKKNKKERLLSERSKILSVNNDDSYNTDIKELVRNAISELPLHYREIITLYYFEEMSVEEIARHLNINPGTVKSRLFTARTLLRNIIEPK